MGAGQSTRDRTDYVNVDMFVDETGYVRLYFFVNNIENSLKVRQFIRKRDDRMPPDVATLEPCEYWPVAGGR